MSETHEYIGLMSSPFMTFISGLPMMAQLSPRDCGTQLFVTTDSADVNLASYGTGTTQTGHLTSVGVTGGTATVAVISSGASSLANSGSTLYSSSR